MKGSGNHLFGCALLIILGPASAAFAEPTSLPCDIYASYGGPCVAAHSTVRLLSSTYTGPLYQVRRDGSKGGKTQDIGVTSSGFADAAAQDAFCATRKCTISIIYDQSGNGNHLRSAPPGQNGHTPDREANAKGAPITISGHNLWGEYNEPGVGYRNVQTKGIANGDRPETIYMIASGTYYNDRCCFEYGNVQLNGQDDGEGSQEAIYFGSCSIWNKGAGNGPWVMADLEGFDARMWAGTGSPFENDPSVSYKYVTAMVKGGNLGTKRLVVKVGNAQAGGLTTVFDGRRQSRWEIMRKEGGITLGTDGMNDKAGQGIFYEGVMTANCSSDEADNAVQANIVSVYGH